MIGWFLGLLGLGGIGAAIAFIPGAPAIAARVLASALQFLKGLPGWAWPIAFLIGTTVFFHMQARSERAKLVKVERALDVAKQGIEDVRVAAKKAIADAVANKERVERRQREISNEKGHAIRGRVVAELSRVRERAQASDNQGGADAAGLPGATGIPSDPFGRNRATILHDAEVCTENTLKAEGWQETWAAFQLVPRIEEGPEK